MEKIILIKYLNNKCSDREFEKLVMWVKKEAYKKNGRNWSLDLWNRFEPEQNIYNKKKFSTLLAEIHHHINLKHLERKGGKVSILSKLTKWLSSSAKILFIPFT